MLRNRAWRTPFGGADPAFDVAFGNPVGLGPFDFSDVDLSALMGGQGDGAPAARNPYLIPLAVGAIALAALLLLPSGGRR